MRFAGLTARVMTFKPEVTRSSTCVLAPTSGPSVLLSPQPDWLTRIEIRGRQMTIELTGPPETRTPEPPDTLQQNGDQTQGQAYDTTVLITEAEVAFGTAAATGVGGKERRWVALLTSIFALPKKLRPKRPYPPRMAYLDRALMM